MYMFENEIYFGSSGDLIIMGGIYYDKIGEESDVKFYSSKSIVRTEYDNKLAKFVHQRFITVLMVHPDTDTIIGYARVLLDTNRFDEIVIDPNFTNKGYCEKLVNYITERYWY